jgi:hypothetical protein
MPSPDPALAAEQAYLARTRADLARMQEHALSLDGDRAGGGGLSTEYLKAALARRARALADDPSTPLFFGRLDFTEDSPAGERHYIGRRHVRDAHGDPAVIDWRADLSRSFYRASRVDPQGVRLRRRFGFDHGRLTAYEDEHLTDAGEPERRSAILAAEIERPRVGPMRDIVATIQPEQDELVRAGLAVTVCVQGAPGTGKTAVGLHRAAYLLYAHRERLSRSGVLVIGPNSSFLRYVGDVLPALGEIDARQVTLGELCSAVPVRAVDPPDVALLKGDPRLAEVLRRAVWAHVRVPTEDLVVTRAPGRWRVARHDLVDIFAELRARDVRYGAARAMLAQRVAHAILLRMEEAGHSPDDRVQDAVARSAGVKAFVAGHWPAVDPVKLVLTLLSDPAALARAADGVLTAQEQQTLRWDGPVRGAARAPWALADAVLVDEVTDLLNRTPSLGHVVLDEAQDLSPMQLRAVGRRCSTGSATLLGDLAQGTTAWAVTSWVDALDHLGQPGGQVESLTLGYRVPGQVLDFASRLLPVIAPGLAPPSAVRADAGSLQIQQVAQGDLLDAAVRATASALDELGLVGVVVADPSADALSRALAEAGIAHDRIEDELDPDRAQRVVVVPSSLVKGLEFDHVVLVEPSAVVEAEERTGGNGLRRLYVALTRAVTSLRVVHTQPLPSPLTPTAPPLTPPIPLPPGAPSCH